MKIMLPYLVIFLLVSFSVTCASKQAKQIEQPPPGLAQNSESSPSPTPTSPATPQSQTADWRGRSGNFSIEWTSENIVVKNSATGKEVFSAKKFAAYRLRTAYKSMLGKNGDPNFEEFYFRYKLLAVAGSMIFLKERASYEPRSYTVETYLAYDWKVPQKKLSLKNFYTPQEILAALLGNEEIKRDLQTREDPPKETPNALNDFFALFNTRGSDAHEVSDRVFDKCWFPTNVFDSFAFIQVEQDKVVADLGIPCRADMRADNIYSLKLTLPVSAAVKAAFAGEAPVIKPDNQDPETLITFLNPRRVSGTNPRN
jgi:hypothetical protein